MTNSYIAHIPEQGVVVLKPDSVAKPGPGQLLVQAQFSSLSPGTEHSLMAGHILPLPQNLGYSLVAKVVEIGEGVEQIQVGDSVVATAAHANYQIIDANAVTPVPMGTDLEQAAFFNLAHTAMYAIRRSGLQLGESCVVLGQGLVGAITAQLARVAGAVPVIVTDIDDTRLQASRAMGVHHAINPQTNSQSIKAVLDDEGLAGVSVVFEATGAREPLEQALDLVAERGRVVIMSQSADGQLPNFADKLMFKGVSLIGGYINSKPFALYRSDLEITRHWPPTLRAGLQRYGNSDCWTSDEDIRVFLRLVKSGGLDLRPLISHRFHWQQLPQAYQQVWNRDSTLLGGLVCWQD
ncbi:zinc-binding alcohol dehydrogenase [Halioxenophilus sp. WMMB6]|uniref:zinc-dependent alcohol dehydrogenase n=1 Tax=Halioxenophilus sp. WMMB6 TaxID=3073815 RepID=UPI00295E333F|nr:zinc-binding alcohol dehydrogenase [Halioxenophilus sp. WMMB6]